MYPIFDLDENGNWKDSGRKASAWQGSIYFDVDANEEGCAGYKINVLSLLKSRQMTREYTFFIADAFSFEIIKDEHVRQVFMFVSMLQQVRRLHDGAK